MKTFIKSLIDGFENIKPLIMFEMLSCKKKFFNYALQPVALLLLSAFVIAINWPYAYVNGASENAGEEFYSYIMAILIVVTTLAAGFSAAVSITTEKEKKTLTLLRMTGLSGFEIVAGKALTVFLYVLVLTIPQLPLIFACPFIGGITFAKICSGLVILAVMTYFYCISAVGISMLFKKNYASVSAFMFFGFFINFGFVFLDYLIFNIPTYRNDGFFRYMMPMYIWGNYFTDYKSQDWNDHFITIFDAPIPAYVVSTAAYFVISLVLTKFISSRFEKYLTWREE